jgi:DNA polymerase-3 subunit alpha
MRRTLAAVKPTNFGDIIALVSLYRPGPMDNIPLFGRRKNGLEAIEYPHPKLEGILAETYGVFVYQEQVMQAAQILAGYSLGDADLLRRAMGKKDQKEMDAQRAALRRRLQEVSDIDAGQGQRTVRLDRQVCRLWLQQEPRRGLCAAGLPDRLAEDALPARILCRIDVLRHAPVGKAGGLVDDMRRAGLRWKGRTSTAARPNSPSSRPTRATRCAMPGRHPQRRRKGDGRDRGRARGERLVRQSGRPVPPRARKAR